MGQSWGRRFRAVGIMKVAEDIIGVVDRVNYTMMEGFWNPPQELEFSTQ